MSFFNTVDISLTANWVRGNEREPGQTSVPADRIPPINANLRVRWQASPAWALGSQLLAAAGQDRLNPRDVRDPRIDPNGTPGWVDLSVFGRWQPAQDWGVRVRIDNLLDRAYREHGSGVDRAGRSVVIELDWTAP